MPATPPPARPKTEGRDVARSKPISAYPPPSRAAEVALRIRREILSKARTEEDLRVNFEMLLRELVPGLSPTYERTLKTSTFTGRTDAMHQRLVIEYESPGSMSRAGARDHAVQQVIDYLTAAAGEEPTEHALSKHVGVATDGHRFVFVRRLGSKWDREELPLSDQSVERLILWLRAMDRKDLSPENLLADFGPQTELAASLVRVLAELVDSHEHPKANVIYAEWLRLFGIVYGEEQLKRARRDAEPKELMATYHLKLGIDYPVLLFAIHTYYALLMKLLATELIVAQGSWADTFVGRLTAQQLQRDLRRLESGDILRGHGIRNVIEQDFFGWYTEAWTPELGALLGSFVKKLTDYDLGSFQLRPERARDLLKDLYHGLIPDTVRHALGEYYTPDWLAEHTVDRAGYDGNPERTLLDASCGSGTFLVTAIQRVRQWLADHDVEWGSNEKTLEAVKLIQRNIVGFDLNPLAVIAARTNYLFALGPLLRYRSQDFEVPVYITDSVLLPGRVRGQTNLYAPNTVGFPTSVGTFELPSEAIERNKVPELMNMLHEAIASEHESESFIVTAVEHLGLDTGPATRTALKTLFDTMKKLDKEGKNRVWARLIRNRYAALFFRNYFDFVVGNPPHVGWETLTPEWRKAAEEEYKHYGLFTLKGLESQHGGGKKDIAALFTYAVADHFLRTDGVIALVVHLSLFKTSGAGEGFRRFRLGQTGTPFAVDEAHDFSSFQPFKTQPGMKIKTRTATFRAVKGKTTEFPIPFHVWDLTARGLIPGHFTWAEASEVLSSKELCAAPLLGESTDKSILSPWLTVRRDEMKRCRRAIAPIGYKPNYVAHAGLCTWLNGAYFMRILEKNRDGTVLVENMHDDGGIKVKKVRAVIEAELVHPLLRGRDLGRWHYEAADSVLVVQDPKTQNGYPERWMQQKYPLTWSYLKEFEQPLRARSGYKKFFDPTDPFYAMYNVGEDSFAAYRVVWMDISSTVKAVVVADRRVAVEHTNMLLATGSEDEAHYVAAVMNSPLFNEIVEGYAVDNHISTHPIKNIVIPHYDAGKPLHAKLAKLSRDAHRAAKTGDESIVRAAERDIDASADGLWAK